MAKRRGGAIFQNVDPLTGISSWTLLSKMLFTLFIIILVALAGYSIYLAIAILTETSPGGSAQKGGGAVAPPISKIPGRITIAEVAQSPSAGQAIIYFSQAEAAGTTCDTCTATFDINLTYVGGLPSQPPADKTVTAPATSGTVIFDYSVPTQTGGSTSPTPSPPTQVTVSITARSVSSEDPTKSGAPTTFTKSIPYVF